MADEQYKWLDRETAERLLRGEPLDAVDADARAQAERLAGALGELTPKQPLTSEEIPGEGAALAAFRKARADRDAELAAAAEAGRAHPSDAGTVRPGRRPRAVAITVARPRWARRARFGLAAAVAAAMVGGVAVAAGTGVIRTPFGGSERGPSTPVSATPTPGGPLAPGTPDGSGGVDSAVSAGPGTGRGSDDAGAGGRDAGDKDREEGARPDAKSEAFAAACRAVRDGKKLDESSKRALVGEAGGSTRVGAYCDGVLKDAAATGGAHATGGATGGSSGSSGGTGGAVGTSGAGGGSGAGSGSGTGSASGSGSASGGAQAGQENGSGDAATDAGRSNGGSGSGSGSGSGNGNGNGTGGGTDGGGEPARGNGGGNGRHLGAHHNGTGGGVGGGGDDTERGTLPAPAHRPVNPS
jgi:hypothetical protein